MNRMQLTFATAIVLFLAFGLGWLAHWLLHRLSRVAGGDVSEMDHLAQSLHEAEEGRDQAILYLEAREGELVGQLGSTEAELRAAMEGLRDARAESEGLKAYIEQLQGRKG
jgi:prophage endopeptidase